MAIVLSLTGMSPMPVSLGAKGRSVMRGVHLGLVDLRAPRGVLFEPELERVRAVERGSVRALGGGRLARLVADEEQRRHHSG